MPYTPTPFEEKLLQILTKLEADYKKLQAGQQQLQAGYKKLEAGQEELRAGQNDLKHSVRRLEVLHEATAGKIDGALDVATAQQEHMKTLATKTDIQEVQANLRTVQLAVKATNQDVRGKRFRHLPVKP